MKVITSISALLLFTHSAAYDTSMSFSMYGVKSGKGTSKSGKGNAAKSAKGGTGDSAKSSKKGQFDDCVLSNPSISQVFLLFPFLDEGQGLKSADRGGARNLKASTAAAESRKLVSSKSGLNLEVLLYHAYSLNELFAWAVKHYVNKSKSLQEIWEFGEYILNQHPWWVMYAFYWCEFSCAKLFALVGQMEDTCGDNKFVGAYVNVALALLSGFFNGNYEDGHHGHSQRLGGHGGPPSLNMLTCTYYGEEMSFEAIFGNYITDEVKDLVDFGESCDEDHGHGGHATAAMDFTFAFDEKAAITQFESFTEDEWEGSIDP